MWGCRGDRVTSVLIPAVAASAAVYFWVTGEYKLIASSGSN
jgi:hypothetical protein